MTVRLAVPADARRLADVAAATFPLACPPSVTAEAIADHVASRLSEAVFAGQLADPGHVLLVAETDDDPSGAFPGYAMLVAGEPSDPDVAGALRFRPTCELSKLYVTRDQHGTGTARTLMSRALDEARALGSAGIWLGTNEANARALRFYEKSGFEVVGRRRFRVGDTWAQDYVLESSLA